MPDKPERLRPPAARPARARVSVWRAACVCLLASLVLGGCVSTKFVFNQLDLFVYWQLNGLFSLDRDQEAELREAIRRNLDWVRREQLPRYAQLARGIGEDVRTGRVTAGSVRERYGEIVTLWDGFLRHLAPDAARFLAGLNDEQVTDFLANLEEENQELWAEYAGETPDERVRRREKAAIKATQRLTGRLDRGQKDLVRSYIASMHDNSAEWLAGRRAWQQQFHDLLLERPAEDAYIERLSVLLLNPNATDSEDYRRQVDDNLATVFDMLTALASSLDDRQRDRLDGRLTDFARDFDALAVQPES